MNDRWKMIYLARRNPALAAEDFPQAWREHSALGRQCRNVQDKVLGVTQCSRLLGPSARFPGFCVDYDGVNLMVLRDRDVAADIWDDDETRRIMRPDELRVFSTYVRNFALTCREVMIRAAPQTEVCVIGFLRWRAGAGVPTEMQGFGESFAWARASRLVWNEVQGEAPPGYDYDAVIECWFESVEALTDAFAGCDPLAQLPTALASRVDVASSLCLATHVTHRRP